MVDLRNQLADLWRQVENNPNNPNNPNNNPINPFNEVALQGK